jgi:hypothetical protein
LEEIVMLAIAVVFIAGVALFLSLIAASEG